MLSPAWNATYHPAPPILTIQLGYDPQSFFANLHCVHKRQFSLLLKTTVETRTHLTNHTLYSWGK